MPPETHAAHARLVEQLTSARNRLQADGDAPSALKKAIARATQEAESFLARLREAKSCGALRNNLYSKDFVMVGYRLGEAFDAASKAHPLPAPRGTP